ncbi:hypothetical protein QFC24_003730 [Naganishia onofrii]|uniref:Uncharacterized protein n=1 Tax=Naganishia onofrii TaxID=1851511 RepID=A0ACC2XIP6_9TREE|nr:hypothetical protein QFC24_003730 [Naganishia onofrii]
MSKPTQPPAATGGKPAAARALTGSKWAHGPPQHSQPASATASPLQSPNPNKEKLATSDSATTSAPPSARQSQAGQPRKAAPPAAAASKPVNIPSPVPAASTPAKNPALNFGTVDNPASTISSSPATKLTTGAHLGEGEKVKSFGSVAAAAAAAQTPAVTTSAPTSEKPTQVNGDKPAPAAEPAAAPAPSQTKPKFDPHKMFQKAPAATPSPAPSAPSAASISPAPVAPVALASPAPVPQQLAQQQNPYAQAQAAQMQPGQPGIPRSQGYTAQGMPMVNAPSFSPSGGPQNGVHNQPRGGPPHRSPIMNHSQPGQFTGSAGAFQPAGGPGIRPPRQNNQQMGGRPMYPPQGMPGQQQYPGMAQAFSPYGYPTYTGHEFNPGYQYQQHYPGQPGGPSAQSPSMGRPPLHNAHSGSFGSNTSGLPPVSGVASPMSPQLAPGTPQQAPRTPSLFSPGAAAFSPGAPAFTPGGGSAAFVPAKPRASAVKITRDDGTAVDLSNVAKTVKSSGPTTAAIAAAASIAATASPKPTGAVPVTVRIESPVQKELRQKELEEEKKRKEQDEREERERKERKEKKEKEDQEAAQKQAEEKKADDQAQVEKETKQAEVEAEKKAADAADEKKASEDAKVAAEKKAADEKASADAEKKATEDAAEKKEQEDKQAAETVKAQSEPEASVVVSEAPSNPSAIAGLPSKPSTEVLEKANLSAPDVSGRASASPSPMASPSISHATLPAKPEVATSQQTSAPQQNGVSSTDNDSPAFGLALKTAKVIEDIRAITYRNGINPAVPALNESAPAGKFRYDREFLLQFANVCKDRVPVETSLDQLGIDPRTAPKVEFRSGSQRGGPRGQGGARGGPGNMAGGGMGNFGRTPGGPGAMGPIGGGGSYSSRPAQTSEERLARSNTGIGAAFGAARNSQGGMSRTTSQASPMGSMQGGMRNTGDRARSTRGKPRGGEGRQPFQVPLDPNVAPLEASANRWTPAVQSRRPGQLDENSPEFVERKVKGLLNKLTAEKFDSISNQILEWANKSVTETDGQTLRLVIKLIFEKAKDEQFWSTMYAKLCRKLWQDINPEVQDAEMTGADGKPLSGGLLFRKYLLNRCQEDFEKGWKQKADASAAAKEKAADDQLKKAAHDAAVEAGKEVEEFKFSDEYYAEQAAKRQGLGLVKFVGELFKLEMLSTRVIHACIVKLLANVVDPDEEDVESLCQLLTTVGAKLEAQPKMSQQVGLYMQRMDDLRNSDHLSSRIRFMVQDVMELQRNKWQERNAKGPTGAMTIDQVHAQARQEAEANRVAAASAMSRNESRGGSRRGQERGGFGGHGGDNWTNVSNKLPAKPADMSAFGKIQAGAGPTSFGPNSIFGKKKGGKASGDTTPPLISRTPSSNMFSALEGHDNAADPASPPTDGAPQQRKRLQLTPRTVDLDQPSTETTVTDVAEDAEGNSEELSEEAIDRKIKNDVEELWGIKDIGGTRKPSDVAEYFESLPESARVKLAKKLVDDVFRIAKQKDTDVVVEGFKLAVEQDVLTASQAKEALMPTVELLDDLSVDIPLAYDFTAQLMAAAKLPQSEVEALADAIETFGEPKITPKDKLLRSFEKISTSAQ